MASLNLLLHCRMNTASSSFATFPSLSHKQKQNSAPLCPCASSSPSSLSSSSSREIISNPALQHESFPIMINGLSGKMGHAVAEAAIGAGLHIVPFGLTGPGLGGQVVNLNNVQVHLHDVSEKEAVMDKVSNQYPNVIIVDYTLPAAVNDNAEFYCKRGLPFVMGTTGGDRDRLFKTVKESGVYAVIAPQMGKQVVAFQAAFAIMAEQFPGAFSGYKLEVTESHQSSKVDTSGTAKAVVSSFRKLGVDFDDDEIKLVRNPEDQITQMEVPEEHLKGHAFHTYSLKSPDGMVNFQFQHNVCGRSIYAQGTVDAVLFLAKKIQEQSDQKIYNMIDVLRGGSMR